MHMRRARSWDWSASSKATMNVHSSDKVPINTLYGPDDKPLSYMYEVEPIKFGFQPGE
jgi:hypothetical protein